MLRFKGSKEPRENGVRRISLLNYIISVQNATLKYQSVKVYVQLEACQLEVSYCRRKS